MKNQPLTQKTKTPNNFLKSFTDKKQLKTGTDYPLYAFKIYRDHLDEMDSLFADAGIQYTVLSGYFGRDEHGPIMLCGIHREEKDNALFLVADQTPMLIVSDQDQKG